MGNERHTNEGSKTMKLSQQTARMVAEIADIRSGDTFHPSILQSSPAYSLSHVSRAITVAKRTGLISVAYLNCEGRPVYKRN